MGKMRKRVLSLLAAAAMTVAMVPSAGVFAAEEKAATYANGSVCSMCAKKVDTWTVFDGKTAYTVENEHKHFYLTGDVEETISEAAFITIGKGGSVCFDLNGYTLTLDHGYFWLSTECTDYASTLNISGKNGGRIYYGGTCAVYQNYGILNIYGGTYTPVNGEAFSTSVTRGVTLVDAQIGGDIISLSRTTCITLKGSAKVKMLDFSSQSNATNGVLNLDSGWTGSASLNLKAEDVVDGKLASERYYYTDQVPLGKLTLSSGEPLEYRDGGIYVYGRLVLDDAGMGRCLYCNQTVKWTEFTGEAITGVDEEHLHYYLSRDIDTTALRDDAPQYLIYLYPKQMMCLHLNGHTLTTGSGIYIKGGDDASTALNIIGYGGKYVYTASRTAVGVELRYDLLRLYGGTYNYAPEAGKSGTMFRVHRYPRFHDVTINGVVDFASVHVVMEVSGNTSITKVDYKGQAALVKIKQDWTGTMQMTLPRNAVVNGVVNPDRLSYIAKSTSALNGKLTLSTGEKLTFRNGQLRVPSLQVNAEGYAQCTVCNESVRWTKFDGTQSFVVKGTHKHFYLDEYTTYALSNADMLTIAEGGAACFCLNGHSLIANNASFRLSSDDAVLNIIGADGTIGYTQKALIQQTAGTVNLYDGTYTPVYGVPFAEASGTVNLHNAAVDGDLIAQDASAVIRLYGKAETGKVNLDNGGKLMLEDDWSGNATLDMDVADLVGGKVPGNKISYNQIPAGKVKLVSGKILDYKDGTLAKPVSLALDAEGRGLCPLCKQTVSWRPLDPVGMMDFGGNTTETHHHVYLADNMFSTENVELIEVYQNHKLCLHLNGYDLTTGSIIHAAGGEINIYGYGSNYTFTGEQAQGNVGLYAYNGGKMNLYGGTYHFAPTQGAEDTLMIVVNEPVRLQDVTLNDDLILDSNTGQLILSGDTNIHGEVHFGKAYLRGTMRVESSFTGSVTIKEAGLISSGYFRDVRGSAEGDFSGTLRMSDGKRLINDGGKLKVALIANPVSWKVLDNLPVANCYMTEEELRQLCVDFFRWTLSFAWTPKEDAYYQNKATNPTKYYYTGKVYGGTPYVTNTTGTLYTALEYYDPITGTLNISGNAKETIMNFSNQCSGSAFWAWNRVCTSVAYSDTSTTLLYYGCLPVGPYTYPENLTQWKANEVSTLKVCQANGQQTMFESYALMKPADGILTVRPNTGKYPANGHNRMITTYPVVVRNSDGTINGSKSYVYYIDQDGEYTSDKQLDGTSYEHIGVNTKFTFIDMFEEAYIPFTFAELIGQKPVEKSVAQIDYTGKTATISDLKAAIVSSNYSISDITITVIDAQGKQVYRNLVHSNKFDQYKPGRTEAKVSHAVDEAALSAFADGKHTVEVSIRIGSGEKPVVYSGILQGMDIAKISGGKTLWYDTAEAAIGEYTAEDFAAGNYIKLFADSAVNLTGGQYYIDGAGFDLQVEGSGKLYAFDSSNAEDFAGFGSWTIAENVEILRDFVAPDGNRYLVTTKDGVTTAHALVLDLAGALVNTEKAGLSYEAQYRCDDALAGLISAYGVIVSLRDMPGAQLEKGDAATRLYRFQPNALHQVFTQSSYVYGIFKESRAPVENAYNGTTKIYANPYIQLNLDGEGEDEVIVGDTENVDKQAGNAWSLYDVLKEIDDNWADYASQQEAVKAFYNTWADFGMNRYDFTNIA